MGLVRQLGATLLAGVIGTCQQPQAEPSRAQAQAAETEAPPPITYFDLASIDADEVVRAVAEAEPAEAMRLGAAALVGASPEREGSLRWLIAAAADVRNDRAEAEAQRRALAASGHALAPWAALALAESLESQSESAEGEEATRLRTDAVALLQPFAALDWAGKDSAERLRLRLGLASGDADALEGLRAMLRDTPSRIGGASIAMPMAAHLAALDDVDAREEALALYRRVATRAPKARVGIEAGERAAAVLESLPAERRRALADVPIEDRFAEAEALYQSMHHRDAERAYGALARSLREEPLLRCQAELQQGNAMLRRRAREEGAPHMHGVAERCEDTDVRAWARYKAGRAYTQIDQRSNALREYAALAVEAPDHRLADDGLYRAALLEDGAGNEAAMIENFRLVVERHPDGDMAGESLFRLALHAWGKGEFSESLRYLDQSIGLGCGAGQPPCEHVRGEEDEDLRGRAHYWRARSLASLGRADEALAAYVELARDWPLSYYGQQAVARVREQSPERATELMAEFRDEGPEALRFPMRAEHSEPWMQRAIALLRVGATSEARRELEDGGALGSGADEDLVWFASAILARAGALPEVTRILRRKLHWFRKTMPHGRGHALWRLAYPRAFSPLIEDKASEAEVPAAFVRAIAREESSFDPNAVSWAHAYGLVQVILPTARANGRGLGPINARTLRDPAINLAVGARFMHTLRSRFAANPALVPAAYNAGQGALDRWIRQRGDLDMDEFVERIPYDETRRYTRRVVQTWGIYTFLDEAELPELPRTVR